MAEITWIDEGTKIKLWDGLDGVVEVSLQGRPYGRYKSGDVFVRRLLTVAGEFGGLWSRVPEEKKARSFTSVLDGLEASALRDIREAARVDRINAFYQMVVKDAGRKIKTPLPVGELGFWEEGKSRVEMYYKLGRNTPFGEKPVSRHVPHTDEGLAEFGLTVSTMTWPLVEGRRRIRYFRGMFCQNKNTDHLKESGWAFWEKCMRNVDAHYAKEREKPVFEWKTSRSGKVNAQRQQVKWTEEISRAFQVPGILIYGGVDYAKKDADVTSVLCGVRGEAPARRGTPGDEPVFRSPPRAPTTVPKVEADLLAAKVSRLESENEILKGKVKAAETRRVEVQEELKQFISDTSGFLISTTCTRSIQYWWRRIKEMAGIIPGG